MSDYYTREAEYRAHKALNQSTIKLWRDGAAKGIYSERNPRPTSKSQGVGLLVERMIYTPGDLRATVRLPENRGPKGENAAKNAAALDAGFILVPEASFAEARTLADLVLATVDLSGFANTVAMFATLYGQPFKCLFDFLDASTDRAYDLKVTEHELTDHWISKSIADLGWHIQAAVYKAIYKANTGRELDYRLILASTVAPQRVEVKPLDAQTLQIGAQEAERLTTYRAQCIASNQYPHKPLGAARLPRYYVPFEAHERKNVNMDALLTELQRDIDAGDLPEGW